MGIAVELRPFHLRVTSSLLINLAAGLILLLFTIHDIIVLTVAALLSTLCIIVAMTIERILDEL